MQCRHNVFTYMSPFERTGATGLNALTIHPFYRNLVFLRANNRKFPKIGFFDILVENHSMYRLDIFFSQHGVVDLIHFLPEYQCITLGYD